MQSWRPHTQRFERPFPKEHTIELHLHTTEQKSTQPNQNTLPSTVHTTGRRKQDTASGILDFRTSPNLRFHKTYRHRMLYFSLWIMSHRQNQLEWGNCPDTDRSRFISRPPFSLEMQHTTEPRCSVVCVYAAWLCAGRLGCVEGHPWIYMSKKCAFNDTTWIAVSLSNLWVRYSWRPISKVWVHPNCEFTLSHWEMEPPLLNKDMVPVIFVSFWTKVESLIIDLINEYPRTDTIITEKIVNINCTKSSGAHPLYMLTHPIHMF